MHAVIDVAPTCPRLARGLKKALRLKAMPFSGCERHRQPITSTDTPATLAWLHIVVYSDTDLADMLYRTGEC